MKLIGVILVLCFVGALSFGSHVRRKIHLNKFQRSRGYLRDSTPNGGEVPQSGSSEVKNSESAPSGQLSGESWEVLPGLSGEASGEVTAGPGGEPSGEVTPGPSADPSIEVATESTGAPSIPARRIHNSFRQISDETSAPVSDEIDIGSSGELSDEASSGPISDESGDSCAGPSFYKLLGFFRGFPKTESKEMNGYEAALYDPLLDAFWAKKDKLGLDKALNLFMMEFSKAFMAEHYQCKGTQLNQILIDVLKDTTTKFMSEAKTYIQSAVDKIKKPVSRAAAPYMYPYMVSHRMRHSKRERNMKDPKSKVQQIVAKTLELLKKVLTEDVASQMETEQFDDMACYLRFVKDHLRSEVEAKVPLKQIKRELAEWSVESFSDLFECTDPFRIVEIYEENWQSVNLPEEENILFQHIGQALEIILSKGGKERQSMDKVLAKDFPLSLTKIIHQFAMKVLTELSPFLDAQSTDEMIAFFKKFLTAEKMKFAEKLIRSLDIFSDSNSKTTSIPEPMTSTAVPVRRTNLNERSELENIMNYLIDRYE
ncbi:unnamed protein product [Mytilus coruscus]|uniref:Uncharacterized protein n=1 Tax=Mytilus coruscus TaxID=42192 RepID=A0A6J8CYR9_MYTCO|nr:unnamed protein product [Mytilus coruscus]